MWMDVDIVLDDMLFDIPLHKYQGKDFVIWGQADKMLAGDVLNGKTFPSLICDHILHSHVCFRGHMDHKSCGQGVAKNKLKIWTWKGADLNLCWQESTVACFFYATLIGRGSF